MILEPKKITSLSDDELQAILKRSMEDISSIYEYVRTLVEDVRQKGDQALLDANREFKQDITVTDLKVSKQEIEKAYEQVEKNVIESLKIARNNIETFHRAQMERDMWSTEVSEGIIAGRITRPIEKIGCYIPGGLAAYPSTTLMTITPAKVAGVSEVIATTPCGQNMEVSPFTLVAAHMAGCETIFKIGGPWGIAAMASGTRTVPKVDKIVGPGNKYVTAAKMIVYGDVDIDSPAGPSEALILADETGDAKLISVDFLSQIEHDPDSAAVFVTTSKELAAQVCEILDSEYKSLPRKEIYESSIRKHSHVLLADDMALAIDFTNEYAPEHLQILTRDPFITLNKIRHAGSIFLGPYAPVPVGDYASGTNHVLPTGQCARMFSGLSVDDFIKKPTFQYLSKQGLASLKDVVATLAEAEGLPIHARAVKARFEED